jgi:hypothetical protein
MQIELIAHRQRRLRVPPAYGARHARQPHAAGLGRDHLHRRSSCKPFDLDKRREGRRPRRHQRRQQDGAPRVRHRRRATGARGVKVVMGGIHATACPGRGRSSTATPIVTRRGRGRVARAARGLQARSSSSAIYKGPSSRTWRAGPSPGRDLFPRKSMCPSRSSRPCAAARTRASSAASRRQNGPTFRFRPADEVIAELKTLGKLILFADDNVMVHRAILQGALHQDGRARQTLGGPVLARWRSSAWRT